MSYDSIDQEKSLIRNNLNVNVKATDNIDINIEELTKIICNVINVSINLRKVKKISIIEKYSVFNPRPQQHLLFLLQFGSFKSTLLKLISKVINGDIIILDDASMPALLGTISKNNQYVEGAISKSGGKILAIDEWDNLSYYAKQALLAPLENQEIHRSLGFNVKEEMKFNDNPFINMSVKGGCIDGKIQFTCIANSMDFAVKVKQQYALGSRFRLIKYDLNSEHLKSIIQGITNFNFIDRNQIVENVTVNNDVWMEYSDLVYDYLEKNSLFPPKGLGGYVNRAIHDGLRDVIGNMIIKDPKESYVIDSIDNFNIKNIIQQIKMYTNDAPMISRLKQLMFDMPNRDYKFYCEELNINQSYFYKLRDEIEGRV